MKITGLAPEHIARFEEWAQKWTEIGLSAEPADFDLATETALKAYGLANLNSPTIILRVGSPVGAVIGGVLSVYSLQEIRKIRQEHPSFEVLDHLWSQIRPLVEGSFLEQVWDQVSSRVQENVSDQLCDKARMEVDTQGRNHLFGNVRKRASAQIWDRFLSRVRKRVRKRVSAVERAQVHDNASAKAWERMYGSALAHEAPGTGLASHYSFYRDVVGLNDPVFEQFRLFETLAKTCGFVWFHEDVLVISDRPEKIYRDMEGRLHNEKGPSISFRDGWCLYHWHGTAVPGEWVTGKPPSAKKALAWENIEQRRAACEMIGWKTILKELDAKMIDEDDSPEIGTLIEAKLPGVRGRMERFLQVRCGTGREFVLPVPPQVRTALEANAWTWNLKPAEYRPEVRT